MSTPEDLLPFCRRCTYAMRATACIDCRKQPLFMGKPCNFIANDPMTTDGLRRVVAESGLSAQGKKEMSVVFNCCDPCRDGRCGQECGHGALDQKEMEDYAALFSMHAGCRCTVRALGHIDFITLDVTIGKASA